RIELLHPLVRHAELLESRNRRLDLVPAERHLRFAAAKLGVAGFELFIATNQFATPLVEFPRLQREVLTLVDDRLVPTIDRLFEVLELRLAIRQAFDFLV